MTKIENKKSLLSLLDILNEKNSKKPTKIDFLLNLLKEIDDKKIIKELIIKSNLDKNTKEKLFKFFKIDLKEIKINKELNIFKIEKNISMPKNKINEKNSPKKENENNSILEKLISQLSHTSNSNNLETDLEILKKEISNQPKNIQKEIVKEIKAIIIMKKNNPSIKKVIISNDFKNVTTFKDILNLSKKFKLNILKIAIKQISQTKPKPHSQIFITASEITKKFKNINIKTSKPINKKINILNNILNFENQKTQKKTDKNSLNTNHISTKNIKENFPIINKKISKINKKEEYHHNFETLQPSITNIKHKIIEAKQTIKHFASSLKEAVENYKPPITKLTLELHPKELGKVDVTIQQRGENLQVQINTNNQTTINLFIQNQNELKNSLVNMGFTNINMNFNSNDNQQKKQNQQKQQLTSKIENEENDELVIDFTYKYA